MLADSSYQEMEIELNKYLDNIASFLGMELLVRSKNIVQKYRDLLDEEKAQDTTTVEANLDKVLYKRQQLRNNLKSKGFEQAQADYLKEHQASLKVARKSTKTTHVAAGCGSLPKAIPKAAAQSGAPNNLDKDISKQLGQISEQDLTSASQDSDKVNVDEDAQDKEDPAQAPIFWHELPDEGFVCPGAEDEDTGVIIDRVKFKV